MVYWSCNFPRCLGGFESQLVHGLMKNIRTLSAFVSSVLILSMGVVGAHARSLSDDVAGKILLQVEGHGEAWYVNPTTKQRHFLNRPADALTVMRGQGVGVTDSDLSKIPIGFSEATMGGQDTDKDGLTDAFEDALGTDKDKADTDGDGHIDGIEVRNGYSPFGSGKPTHDTTFAAKQKGKIFLQVQKHGEGWWVNPEDGKRYFLGGPLDAFGVMRAKALGISNKDLATIPENGVVASESVAMTQKTPEVPSSSSSSSGCGVYKAKDDASPENVKAVACFDAHFATCDLASIDFDFGLSGINHYKISGAQGDTCVVEYLYNKSPNLDPNIPTPEDGKMMTCLYDKAVPFSKVAFSKNALDTCTGPLKDIMAGSSGSAN